MGGMGFGFRTSFGWWDLILSVPMRIFPTIALTVLLAACLAGCAGALRGPDAGGDPWTEVKTDHVTLYTDHDPETAVEIAVDLESSYRGIGQFSFSCAFERGVPPSVTAVVFEREADFESIKPPWMSSSTGGFYTQSDLFGLRPRSMIVYFGKANEKGKEVFQHELTHRLVHHCYPAAPIWLNEGLACVFETARIEKESIVVGHGKYLFGDRWKAGGHGAERYLVVPRDELISVGDMTRMTHRDFYGRGGERFEDEAAVVRNYAESWALVHLLMFGDDDLADTLGRYLISLRNGYGEFSSRLEDFADMDELQQKFGSAVYRNAFDKFEAKIEKDEIGMWVRTMEWEETYLLWADLLPLTGEEGRARAKGYVEAALAENPDSARARIFAAALDAVTVRGDGAVVDSESLTKRLEKLVVEYPGDVEVLMGYAEYRLRGKPDPELVAPLATVLGPLLESPSDARGQELAARYHILAGDPERAGALLEKAIEDQPSYCNTYVTYARLIAARGEIERARGYLQAALNLLPDGEKENRQRLVKLMMELGRGAGEAGDDRGGAAGE